MIRPLTNAVSALALIGLAGCSSLIAPVLKPDVSVNAADIAGGGDYVLDTKHASILFKIDHLGYSTYVGRFERFDGILQGDAAAPDSAAVAINIDMTSLDIANDEFAETLMGPDWFNAETYPQAVFASSSVTLTSETTADIYGALEMNGKVAPITLKATFNGGGFDRLRNTDVVGFSATTTIDRTQFGIDKYKGLITNDVTIEIEAEFMKR